MRTRNVTLAISHEAHHKARLWAAQYDVSLSAVVSALLEGLPTNPNARRAANAISHKTAITDTQPPTVQTTAI
jgi:hypothetical protein